MDGANVCGITRTNWSKPHTNSGTPRDTRTTSVRLRSRRLHPLKHQVHPLVFSFRISVNGPDICGLPQKTTTGQNHTPTTVVVQICRVLAWRPCIIVYREAGVHAKLDDRVGLLCAEIPVTPPSPATYPVTNVSPLFLSRYLLGQRDSTRPCRTAVRRDPGDPPSQATDSAPVLWWSTGTDSIG